MKPEYKDLPLIKNEEKQRFEVNIDGYFAFIDYKERGDTISLIHTEVDPALAGRGASVAVVEKTLQYIADNKKSLKPFCPYVFTFIRRHPEWKRIVDPSFPSYDKL